MVPRDEDHTVCSNRCRDKLLLLFLRKVEPEVFSPDDVRKRRNRVCERRLLLCGATRLAKILPGVSIL
jgi:hypothetical protein